jgi:hypothetical protein
MNHHRLRPRALQDQSGAVHWRNGNDLLIRV